MIESLWHVLISRISWPPPYLQQMMFYVDNIYFNKTERTHFKIMTALIYHEEGRMYYSSHITRSKQTGWSRSTSKFVNERIHNCLHVECQLVYNILGTKYPCFVTGCCTMKWKMSLLIVMNHRTENLSFLGFIGFCLGDRLRIN